MVKIDLAEYQANSNGLKICHQLIQTSIGMNPNLSCEFHFLTIPFVGNFK